MDEKNYVVRLRLPRMALQHVTAARFEIQGEHLAFVDGGGKLTALFLMDLVESWNVLADREAK